MTLCVCKYARANMRAIVYKRSGGAVTVKEESRLSFLFRWRRPAVANGSSLSPISFSFDVVCVYTHIMQTCMLHIQHENQQSTRARIQIGEMFTHTRTHIRKRRHGVHDENGLIAERKRRDLEMLVRALYFLRVWWKELGAHFSPRTRALLASVGACVCSIHKYNTYICTYRRG